MQQHNDEDYLGFFGTMVPYIRNFSQQSWLIPEASTCFGCLRLKNKSISK